MVLRGVLWLMLALLTGYFGYNLVDKIKRLTETLERVRGYEYHKSGGRGEHTSSLPSFTAGKLPIRVRISFVFAVCLLVLFVRGIAWILQAALVGNIETLVEEPLTAGEDLLYELFLYWIPDLLPT
jgi:hypothetical protein